MHLARQHLHSAAFLFLAVITLAGCARATPAPATASAPSTADALRPVPAPRSAYDDLSVETQALQDDPFANPGLLWVDQGRELWADESRGPSCASCHTGEGAAHPLATAVTRYPRLDPQGGGLINLTQQINRCRTERQQLPKLPYESEPLLALTTYLKSLARGEPVTLTAEPDLLPYLLRGEAYYYERRGQMNLACHHCHERHVGQLLRGDRLSQGLGNGYPAYRLEWQTLGSLHRRLRLCNTGIRAEPFAYGAQAYLALELYLKWRARGLLHETPAVRR